MNYNSKEGVLLSVSSLKGLNELVDEKQAAGYIRKERLNQFIVMGTWFLDSCGNCMRITEAPEGLNKFKVLTPEEVKSNFSYNNITLL